MATKREKEYEEAAAQRGGAGRGNEASDTDPAPGKPKRPAGGEAPGAADMDKPAGEKTAGQKQRNGKQAAEPGGEKPTAKGKAAEPGGEEPTAKGKSSEPGGEKSTAKGKSAEPDGEKPSEKGKAAEPGGENPTAKGKAAEPDGENPTAKGKEAEPGGGKSTAGGTEKEPGKSLGGQTRALEKIWSRRMALIGLKRIYETALEGARIEIRDEDGALVEVKFNPSAANAATKAIEAANKMLGYAAPEEEKAGASLFSVELGEAEDFAE